MPNQKTQSVNVLSTIEKANNNLIALIVTAFPNLKSVSPCVILPRDRKASTIESHFEFAAFEKDRHQVNAIHIDRKCWHSVERMVLNIVYALAVGKARETDVIKTDRLSFNADLCGHFQNLYGLTIRTEKGQPQKMSHPVSVAVSGSTLDNLVKSIKRDDLSAWLPCYDESSTQAPKNRYTYRCRCGDVKWIGEQKLNSNLEKSTATIDFGKCKKCGQPISLRDQDGNPQNVEQPTEDIDAQLDADIAAERAEQDRILQTT